MASGEQQTAFAQARSVPPYEVSRRPNAQPPLVRLDSKKSRHRPAKNHRLHQKQKAKSSDILASIERRLSGIYGNRWLPGKVRMSILRIPELRNTLMARKRNNRELGEAVDRLLAEVKDGKRTLGGPEQIPLRPWVAHYPPYHPHAKSV